MARIKGRGSAPTLMLYGHADVVTTAHQTWAQPPFAGHLADGYVWGRGTLDMKGGLAMMLSAILDQAVQQREPAGDILLVILSDEENGGGLGAGFLVEDYPELFSDVCYALGEFGGHTTYIGPPTVLSDSDRREAIVLDEGHPARSWRTRGAPHAQRGHGKIGGGCCVLWTAGACRCMSPRRPGRWWRPWRPLCRACAVRFCANCAARG